MSDGRCRFALMTNCCAIANVAGMIRPFPTTTMQQDQNNHTEHNSEMTKVTWGLKESSVQETELQSACPDLP